MKGGGGGGGVIWIVQRKMKKWEIRGTCFQGNRGLEKYRQAGLFILHTALALWQDTADTSNDSKTLTGPAAKILPGIK